MHTQVDESRGFGHGATLWCGAAGLKEKLTRVEILSHSENYLDGRLVALILSHMDNKLDTFFAALADPTRRAVIERLINGPAAVSDLHAPHDIALPTFMKHLSRLEAAGLVRTHKKGRVRTVHIEAAPLAAAESWLSKQRSLWESRLNRLDALANHMERNAL